MHSHFKAYFEVKFTEKEVLILVVTEDALAPQNLGYALFKRIVRLDCAS